VTRLAGKVALITGGGTGIGRGIALACAREGAKVAVVGRRLEKLQIVVGEIKAAGGEAIGVACDVSRAADAQNAIRCTAETFGKLDVLVNNAGVLSVSTIEEIPEHEWDNLIAANLKGPFLMCRAALPEFRKVGGGSIVNVGSVLGLVAMKKRAAYCASKGGVTLLTKAIAIDHGHENIRANCICPSIVETDLVSELFKTPDGERAKLDRLATIPLGRFGKPADIAGLAVFLASDESSWLTGVAIPVDGGLTAA
jgi:NAD(P)-dependent dehydrogenase (short-subunit alcohol dehydrogenase family)